MRVNCTGKKNSKLLTNGFLWMLTPRKIALSLSYKETLKFLAESTKER